MALSRKNKRKIIFRDQPFYWWVKDEFDGNAGMLSINIASEDKHFLVRYYAVQNQPANRYIIVIGKSFPGLEKKTIGWQRFICPDFVPNFDNHGIGPQHVMNILEWCFDPEKILITVNFRGERMG